MLAEARRKLPQAEYVQADIRQSWPMALPPVFELIVSAYVFHHFNLPEKISICADLIEHLTPNGKLILADIAFSNQASMEEFRTMQMDEWEEEFYWLADEAIPAFKQVNMHAVFTPASICSGVFEVDKL
jgi:putative AdoMet-dependent methyltransferase